jgi:hypothetical protein
MTPEDDAALRLVLRRIERRQYYIGCWIISVIAVALAYLAYNSAIMKWGLSEGLALWVAALVFIGVTLYAFWKFDRG